MKIDPAKLRALEAVLDSPGSVADVVEQLRAEPPDIKLAWMHCAFPRQFDRSMFEMVLAVHARQAMFEDFTAAPSVERVPRQEDFYRLRAEARVERLRSWLALDPSLRGLRELAERLLVFFDRTGSGDDLERLRCEVAARPATALGTFNTLYAEADSRFDLSRCQALIQTVSELDAMSTDNVEVELRLLSPELRARCDELRQYSDIRCLFTEEFYRTTRYHQRLALWDDFQNFLKQDKKWIFHVFASGGMGKTMFLRWFVARHCVQERIPVARVDFDYIRLPALRKFPFLVLLPMAEYLDRQIPGKPFGEVLDEWRVYAPVLLPSLTVSPGVNVGGLEVSLQHESEDDWISRFASKLDFSRRVVVMLDTIEEAVLHYPDALGKILDCLCKVQAVGNRMRLVLSGRYDLREEGRLPYFQKNLTEAAECLEIKPFLPGEAEEYLTVQRGLSPDRYPISVLVRKSRMLPMVLALFADLALSYDKLSAEEAEQFEPEFEYLIQRIVNRIPDRDGDVRWVIRYGVIPRRLTKAYLAAVLRPHLERETRRDPAASVDSVSQYENSWRAAEVRPADELWSRLSNYASGYGWLRPAGQEMRFEPEVLQPMRKLLSKEPIFKQLHRESAAYFEGQAADDAEDWNVWVQEAVYHKFCGGDPDAAAYWRALLADPRSEGAGQRALYEVVTGADFVSSECRPRERFDHSAYVDNATLSHAYFGLAASEAESGEPGRARSFLNRARACGGDPKDARLGTVTELRIALREGDRAKAIALANSLLPDPFAHMALGELLEKDKPEQALRHYEEGQTNAHGSTVLVKIARLHSGLGHFREAESAFIRAESRAATDAERLAIELERADLCYRGSRYQEALDILRKGTTAGDPDSRYTRNRLVVQCLLRMWRLREAEVLLRDMGEGQTASQRELAGSVLAALMMPREADRLWEQAEMECRRVGDQPGAARVVMRRVRLALEMTGNVRDAERLIERVTPVNDVQSAQLAELRIVLFISGERSRDQIPVWPEVARLLYSVSLEARTSAAALAAAFRLLPDPEAERLLVANLSGIYPLEARLPYLRVLRYRWESQPIFPALRTVLPEWDFTRSDITAHVLNGIDAWRLSAGAGIAARTLDRCLEDRSHFALRELLNARDRLQMPPVSDDSLSTFFERTKEWGLSYVTWTEQIQRLVIKSDEERARGLLQKALDCGPVSRTQFEATEFRLRAKLYGDAKAADEYHRLREQLGVPMLIEERSGDERVVTVPNDFLLRHPGLMDDLTKRLAYKPETVARFLSGLLNVGPPSADRVLLMVQGGAEALPFEAAFAPEQRCRRGVASGRLFPKRKENPHQVIVVESSFGSNETRQRGTYILRSNLVTKYLTHRLNAHNVPVGELEYALSKYVPSVIHFRAGFRQATGGPVYLSLSDSRGELPLTIDVIVKGLSQLNQPPVLIILDPPLPPDPVEAARQAILRNQFAAELFQSRTTGGVLAMGLESTEAVEAFDKEFTRRLGTGQPVPDIVEWMRRSAASPLARLAAALFTQDPVLQLQITQPA